MWGEGKCKLYLFKPFLTSNIKHAYFPFPVQSGWIELELHTFIGEIGKFKFATFSRGKISLSKKARIIYNFRSYLSSRSTLGKNF